jgi:hypothetical protein
VWSGAPKIGDEAKSSSQKHARWFGLTHKKARQGFRPSVE